MLTPVFPVKAMHREYLFVPDGSRTRVTVNGEFTMVGGLRFASGLMQRRATTSNQLRLDAAKRVLEAG